MIIQIILSIEYCVVGIHIQIRKVISDWHNRVANRVSYSSDCKNVSIFYVISNNGFQQNNPSDYFCLFTSEKLSVIYLYVRCLYYLIPIGSQAPLLLHQLASIIDDNLQISLWLCAFLHFGTLKILRLSYKAPCLYK